MNVQNTKPLVMVPGPVYPDLFDDETPIMLPGEAVCIGCGCSDFNPCITRSYINLNHGEPCYWLAVNYSAGIGACSQCPECAPIIQNWEKITSERNRRGTCRHCGYEKRWLVVETFDRTIAMRYCEYCYGW